jgi:hypothetical protein
LGNKEEDGIARLQTSVVPVVPVVPVAASDSQSSLDTAVVMTETNSVSDTAVAAESGKSQHENAITLSLTE